MSTKIYNGYRLPEGLTMDGVFQWLRPLKAALRETVEENWHQTLGRSSLEAFDLQTARTKGMQLGGEGLGPRSSPWSNARQRWLDDLRECQQTQRWCFVDPEVNLSVFYTQQRLYALFFGTQKNLQEVFEKTEGVSEFNYWNNAEQPNGISNKQWEQRGETWEALLGPTGIPSEESASFQLVGKDHLMFCRPKDAFATQNLAELHALKERAHRVALNSPAAQLPEDLRQEYEKHKSFSVYMGHLRRLEKGEDEAFNQIRDQIAQLLEPVVSLADLQMTGEEWETRRCAARARAPSP